MTVPTPQLLSADLWNRLLDLGEDDRVGLDRINWQLRKLVRDRPSDFSARVALAFGLLLGGDRDGGLQHIEAAHGLWRQSDSRGIYDFISILVDIGQLTAARDFLSRFIDHDFSRKNENVHNVSCAYGLRSGDVEWMDRALHETGFDDDNTREFVKEIKRQELVVAFRLHQDLVESVVSPFSCTSNSSINLDDAGQPVASVRYHTTLIGRERLQLYRRIARLKTDPEVIKVSPFISYGILGPQIQAVEGGL